VVSGTWLGPGDLKIRLEILQSLQGSGTEDLEGFNSKTLEEDFALKI